MSLDLQYDVIPWEPNAQKGVYTVSQQEGIIEVMIV